MNDARPNPLDILAAERLQKTRNANPVPAYPLGGHAVNPEAERAVIAALFRNPDGREMIRLGITPDLFALDATHEAFRAIIALAADGIPPDAATMSRAVSPATKIEIETSLQEHVSAANLPTYVALLKSCRSERQVQAATERLAKAAMAGSPDHELQAILESVRSARQCDPGRNPFTDVGELCALPPTENWLIRGYFTLDSLSVMFGDPGGGKSFLAIDIACHVATGRDWRGSKVRAGKVLYIAGEGRNGLSKRFKAWFEQHDETPRNIQLCLSPIALTDPASVAKLIADIQAMPEPPVLIIVDTINRNFGPGDENATADMTKAVAGLDAIRNATGAAILAAHHSGHGDKSRGRGSSVLRASVDVEYATEKFDRTVQVRCTKAKDFDHPAPLAWTLEKQELPWADETGAPLDSAILVPADLHEPPPPPNSCRIGANQSKALDALRTLYRSHQANLVHAGTDPGTARVAKSDWYAAMKAAGLARNRCTDAKNELVRRGLVRDEGEFVYLTDPVPDFVPDFVPDLYRTVPESAKASCTVPYRGTYKVPGRTVHEAGTAGRGTDHESQPESPIVRTIVNAVSVKDGITREELERTANRAHPKAGALVPATVNELLRSGRVVDSGGRLGLALIQGGMIKPAGVEVRS